MQSSDAIFFCAVNVVLPSSSSPLSGSELYLSMAAPKSLGHSSIHLSDCRCPSPSTLVFSTPPSASESNGSLRSLIMGIFERLEKSLLRYYASHPRIVMTLEIRCLVGMVCVHRHGRHSRLVSWTQIEFSI